MSSPLRKRGFPADHPLSYAKIERMATFLRQIIAPGKAITQALPGWAMFESLGKYHVTVNKRDIPLDYDVKDFPSGVEALTRYDATEGKIIITCAESTYERLENDEPRARFSLCHEIGHAVLHSAELVRLSLIPHRQAALYRDSLPDHPLYQDTEWQADAFAAALLMPAQALAQLAKEQPLSSRLIQKQFNVSPQAAVVRLEIFQKRKGELA